MSRSSTRWSASQTDGSPKFLSLPEQIRLIFASSKSLDRYLDFTMNSYTKHNYLTKVEVDQVTRRSGKVPGLPTPSGPFQPGYPNLDQRLLRDHHDLSIFLVYILHAKEQQIEFGELDLKTNFEDVKLSLILLRDHIESVLTKRRVLITHHVDSSVIPETLKNYKKPKQRYYRDYLTMRDTRLFVKDFCTSYETLFHHIS